MIEPNTVYFSFAGDSRRKIDAAKFVVPDYMNPKVRLKNIWDELADVGVSVNLLPLDNMNKTISIRYNTKTHTLFSDDSIGGSS